MNIISGLLTTANFVIMGIGLWKLIKIYWQDGSKIKHTRKEFIHMIFIMIIIGMIPSLPGFCVHTADVVMKPLTAIVDYVTGQASDAVTHSMKGH